MDPGLKYIFPPNTLLKQVHFLSWLCSFLKTHIAFIGRLPGLPSVVFVLQTCSSPQVLPVRGARSQQYFIIKSSLPVILIVRTCQMPAKFQKLLHPSAPLSLWLLAGIRCVNTRSCWLQTVLFWLEKTPTIYHLNQPGLV